MDRDYKTVVQGEASESEDDSEEAKLEQNEPNAIVIEGEASESDEEELDTSLQSPNRELPPLKLEHSVSFDSNDDISNVPTLSLKQAGKPKFENVLNRKLWESNLSLCNNLNGIASQAFLSAAKDLNNCGQQLSRSHASIQDVSHHMRLMTNDLFNLQDKIDIIATCKILPHINIPI
ncbi:biogenesis of lysosome-related organelles complex 1 subunit 3-like [Physella acuta]|uniref:biogenesis of lysosome-related organelles complex 1 subunit 3-like n=1 Tax=Physella acuta TaxID=109671 RepID=UPI0027DEA813|nr:biogenesis of lysosome-related organelles complex 1 subunit 3-like [Physella acuta]